MVDDNAKKTNSTVRTEKITLADIARHVGVSRTAVSVVLNGSRSGTRVSPAIREKIQVAAKELDYRPNAVAQGLSRKRMNNLGILSMEDHAGPNLYLMALLNGILQAGMDHRQGMTIFGGEDWKKVQQNLERIGEDRCDGFLLIGTPEENELVTLLSKRSLPLVLVNETAKVSPLSSVDVENSMGANEIVTYLIEQGHHRIAILCGNEEQACTHERREGYRRALEAAGLPFDPALVLPGRYSQHWGATHTRTLMQLDPLLRPTALFCSNDAIAEGALRMLRELNIAVPAEISVVGFDDVLTSALLQPPLTTMKQPFEQIGRRAVEILLAQIAGEVESGYKERLAPTLMVRESVCPRFRRD